MRKIERWTGILSMAASMLYSQHGMAVDYTTMNVPVGQTLDIGPSDKVFTATSLNNQGGLLSNIRGTLNNQGVITTRGGIMTQGTLNNHRFILDEGYFSIGEGGGTVVNHVDGQIYMFGPWLHLYSDKALFENAGTFVFGPSKDSNMWSGIWSKGTIKNTGTMILDRNRESSVCIGSDTVNYLVNEGRFFIENGTVCDFNSQGNNGAAAVYTQNAGEIKVNGTFGANEITVNKGLLSGSGAIKGNFLSNPLYDGVTIAPGGALGTLSIVPEEGYLMCFGCSIDIELAGDTQSDQLHVEGEFYMSSGMINVVLRDGYVPSPGSRFSIVTATLVDDLSAPISNLPELPNGRTWSVQNTGTEIILTAN